MKTANFLPKIAALGTFALGLGLAVDLIAQESQSAPVGNQPVDARPALSTKSELPRDDRDQTDGESSKLREVFRSPKSGGQTNRGKRASLAQSLVRDRLKQVATRQPEFVGKLAGAPQTKAIPAIDPHLPGANKPADGKEALMLNKSGGIGEPVAKSPVGSATAAPLPGVIRARGANPAVIGGLTASSAKYSAAGINGTAVNRKP